MVANFHVCVCTPNFDSVAGHTQALCTQAYPHSSCSFLMLIRILARPPGQLHSRFE